MIDIAVIVGANRTKAEAEFRDVLRFEMDLAKVLQSIVFNFYVKKLII